MPLQVSEVTTYEEWRPVFDIELDAFEKPHNAHFTALSGPTPDDFANRVWKWGEAPPGTRRLKVTDSDTGAIVGGAEWVVHTEDPLAKAGPIMTADWWPKDNPRYDIANQIFKTFFSKRYGRMNRPHVLLAACFVGQAYRRRGVGRVIMDWGVKLIDELGMEAFVEATEDGKLLYERYGFYPVDWYHVDAHADAPTAEWAAAKRAIVPEPFRVWFMWRPAGGKFVPGETKYSWEVDGAKA